MGHVVDQWMRRDKATGRRVKGPRWGKGQRWLARWTEPDGRVTSRAFPSRDAAEAHLARVDVDIRGGHYVVESRETFEQYAKRWLAHQLHQRASTAEQAESKLRLHAFPVIGHLPVSRVTRGQVQEVISSAESLGPESRKLLLVYLKAVFDAAVEDRLVSVSPVRRIRVPEAVPRRVHPLSVELVRAIAERMTPHLRGAVWFAAGTGLRPGELRGLTVDRVGDGRVLVDRQLAHASRSGAPVWGPLKNSAKVPSRALRLAPVTLARLEEHLEAFPPGEHGLVFTSARGRALTRSTLSSAWEAATTGLGLPARSGWHDLRHHHASLLIAQGLSPRAVADRLGHANPSETLATYSHLWPSDEGRILAAIDAAHGDGAPDAAQQ